MSLLIDLPADTQARLEQKAQQKGLAPEQIVRELVERMFPASSIEDTLPKTGAELLAAWQKGQALGAFKDQPHDFAQRLRRTVWEREPGREE